VATQSYDAMLENIGCEGSCTRKQVAPDYVRAAKKEWKNCCDIATKGKLERASRSREVYSAGDGCQGFGDAFDAATGWAATAEVQITAATALSREGTPEGLRRF